MVPREEEVYDDVSEPKTKDASTQYDPPAPETKDGSCQVALPIEKAKRNSKCNYLTYS